MRALAIPVSTLFLISVSAAAIPGAAAFALIAISEIS